ncbi:hypothetical protein L1857_25175 [Amycolatopsis thermalba]|uniref:Uncharacterized protein n=1 Tax=Amycolatopsis thermalba TaxID=944492 RepID=A0ABY4P0Q7_9PSEU|nr:MULTISPECIES: hypothetical protein [Amycolatopsis]UQS25866.1 hypothetical protein L1857_25175 [Amycolatopsis thermalba]
MALENVWIRTLGDGLVRADQIIGISNHRTPSMTGKPGRWLLTVALPVATGSGSADGWGLTNLHRTLVQTDQEVAGAPDRLARLLAQLAAVDTAGVITATPCGPDRSDVRFEFSRFEAEAAPATSEAQPEAVPEVVGVR